LNSVEVVNDKQKRVMASKIKKVFGDELSGKTIALWGLAFKPNTDDMREASSRVFLDMIWEAGAKVRAFDPEAMDETKRIYGKRDDLILCNSPEEALKSADALAILTEWNVFRSPDFELIKKELNNPLIFDGRNLYDPDKMQELGIRYYAIGRGLV
jgi:UDPglucose 6-dehydrogenase